MPFQLFIDKSEEYILKKQMIWAMTWMSFDTKKAKLPTLIDYLENTPRGRMEYLEWYLKLHYINIPTCAM